MEEVIPRSPFRTYLNGRFIDRDKFVLVIGMPLGQILATMPRVREALRTQYTALHQQILSIVRGYRTSRRLMKATNVGSVVALTFKPTIDNPHNFLRSKAVGAHFGLTPREYQSGENNMAGAIGRMGDAAVRTTPYQAAHIILSRKMPYSSPNVWAMQVAKRRSLKRAKVACARKLATILHHMWIEETDFRWGKETTVAAV